MTDKNDNDMITIVRNTLNGERTIGILPKNRSSTEVKSLLLESLATISYAEGKFSEKGIKFKDFLKLFVMLYVDTLCDTLKVALEMNLFENSTEH